MCEVESLKLKVERKGEERGFNAEITEDTEFAEKKKAKERSLHCAARRARKRRAGESRVPLCGIGMTRLLLGAQSSQKSAEKRRGSEESDRQRFPFAGKREGWAPSSSNASWG